MQQVVTNSQSSFLSRTRNSKFVRSVVTSQSASGQQAEHQRTLFYDNGRIKQHEQEQQLCYMSTAGHRRCVRIVGASSTSAVLFSLVWSVNLADTRENFYVEVPRQTNSVADD